MYTMPNINDDSKLDANYAKLGMINLNVSK